MRKLKVGLLLLFSMLLSLCLFACKPTDEPGGPGEPTGDQLTRAQFVGDDTITLTDAETVGDAYTDAFNEAVAGLRIRTFAGSTMVEINGTQCDYDLSGVTWGEYGVYTATVTPKTQGDINNAGNITVSTPLTIRIEHAFGAANDQGISTCEKEGCPAVRTTQTLSDGQAEVLNYGAFHNGPTANNTENGDLTQLRAFGTVPQGNTDTTVNTMTVGKLRKGSSVTVTGTAHTTSSTEAYYFPNIGIALREFDASTSPYGKSQTYQGGMSVIVRNDGWVLLNGIGDNGVNAYGQGRLLGGLNGEMLSDDEGEKGARYNYGSIPDDTTEPNDYLLALTDYDAGNVPANTADWYDWIVYSSGAITRTEDYRDEAKEIRLTWTFRPDNIIELIYENITENKTLTARIKVPDEYADSQFDTILHGDYVDMTFTSISSVEPQQLNSVRFNGLDDTATKYYAEGMAFNLDDLDGKVEIDYQMSEGNWLGTDDFELQVYRGEAVTSQPDENAEGWTTLGTGTRLEADDHYFRIAVTVGNTTKYDYMALGDEDFITSIVANKITDVYGYRFDVGGTAADSASLGSVGFAASEDGTQVVIAPTGLASNGTGLPFANYVALRIYGAGFNAAVEKPESGSYRIAAVTDSYLDILVEVGGAADTVTLTGGDNGLQATTVVIDVSGMTLPVVSAEITGYAVDGYEGALADIPVNTGADVTFKFTMSKEAYESAMVGFANSPYADTAVKAFKALIDEFNALTENKQLELETDYGTIVVKDVSAADSGDNKVVTVTFAIPAVEGIPDSSYVTLYVFDNGDDFEPNEVKMYYGAPVAVSGDPGLRHELSVAGYTVYLVADGTDLYYYVARTDSDLSEGDIGTGSLWLNVNGGEGSSAPAFIDIGFTYADGSIVFNDETFAEIVEYSLAVNGTTDNSLDYDTGFFFAGVIDTTQYGVQAGSGDYEYYFQLGNAWDQTSAYNTYKVSYTAEGATTVIAQESDLTLGGLYTIKDGTCLDAGLFAYEVTNDAGEVVFYANIFTAGGSHSGSVGTCEYCGATISRTRTYTGSIQDNEFIEVNETYTGFINGAASAEDEAKQANLYNGMRLEIGLSNGTFYSVRADGFVSFNDYENPASGDNIVHSLDEDGDIGLRTPIGKLNGVTGEPITEETYLGTIDGSGNRVNGVLATGTFRINVSYENGTVTVVYRLYQDGHDDFRTDAPYFEFTVAISGLTDAELDIEFFADNVNIGNSSNVWMTTGDINNTMISSFSGDSDTITAGGEAFTAAGSYSSLGVEGGYALVAGEGNARDLTDEQKKALGIPDGDTTYEKYVAFTVNFEKAYAGEDSIVSAKVVGEPYAFAAFSDDKTALNVVIPFAGEKTEYVIDLSNSGGYTLQADISLDLSAVSTYSVSTQVSGEPTLGGGGQMTITYSGPDLPANVSFRVNGADVAVGSSSADGVMLVSYKDNTLTLTLPSFVSAPKAFTIDMINADNGLLVASRTVSATTVGSDSNTATVETDDGTAYAVVNGNNLAVVFAGVAPGSTQDLWINANMGTANDVSLIGWKNYQFTTYASGAIEFTNAANNAATDSIGYYFVEGRWYAVVNIGLAPMGVTANADYGFELSFAESAVAASEGYVTYYFVSAGSVEEKQVSADTAATEIVPNSCTTVGYNGIRVEGGKFYANISVEPAHDWRESDVDGQYICSVCGAILHSGSATNASIDALGTTEAGSLVDTGLTVSFWMSGATSDWGAIGLSVGSGSVKITMPNLDSWAPNLGSGATEREQELAELVKETNAYPNASNLQSGFDYATFLNKSVYATIVISMTEGIKYYANGELAVEYQINVDLSTDNGKHPLQSQYFAELFLLLAQRQGFVISQSGMQAENAIIERDTLTADEVAARYTAYLAEHSYYPAGAETPTHPEWDEDGAFVIGAADNSTAYTIDLKTYGVERGETLTLEGTLTSKGNDPKEGETTFGAWNAPVITLYNGISVSPVTIRADNWVLGADSGQSGEKAACSSLGWTIQKTAPALENTIEENTDVWAEIRPIMNGSTLRIAFSYSADGKSFTVAYTFISDGHSWTETYVLTSSDGAELGDDAFSFGIGVDRCSYNVTSFVRS
ncbi:MAG TPA: hypothetical protein H9676_04740 [Firmicutes bacterium]|nr:hypothetical protein [Bacillota bacterium]